MQYEEKLISLFYRAGEILKNAHLKKDQIFQKEGEANFVTYYDQKIQSFLIQEIRQLFPEAAFFGEEEEAENTGKIAESGYTFIIDPIDGTTNFLFDYRNSCISVGVAKDGALLAGYVYNPFTDELFWGERGKGSWCNGKRLSIQDLSLEEGIVAFGCAKYNKEKSKEVFHMVNSLFDIALAIRNGGSSTIDLCRIAKGSNVAYFENKLQPYDYAAAAVIIEEAGGRIMQMDGTEITVHHPCSVLAGTSKACQAILKLRNQQTKIL